MDQTLIIGLGNPDPTLKKTYHNVGVLAVEWLKEHAATSTGTAPFRRHGELFEYAKVNGAILVRPLVYMNESGRAVHAAMSAFDIAVKNIIIIHDDSDITTGEYRIVADGRAAGHKGIQSIIEHIGTEAFERVRIGIRQKDEVHRKKAGEFVLSPITAADTIIFESVFEKVGDKIFNQSER